MPGSPWMPSPSSIFPGSTLNRGWDSPGSVHPAKATPKVRVTSLAALPMRSTSSMDRPWSAAALMTLKTGTSPAMPRRFSFSSTEAEATSSVTSTVRQSIPSARSRSWAASKFRTSPA
jgi:hypothetical protein